MITKERVEIAIPRVNVDIRSGLVPIAYYVFGLTIHPMINHSFWLSAGVGVLIGLSVRSACRYIASRYIIEIVCNSTGVQVKKTPVE